jgi:hypothetical protein
VRAGPAFSKNFDYCCGGDDGLGAFGLSLGGVFVLGVVLGCAVSLGAAVFGPPVWFDVEGAGALFMLLGSLPGCAGCSVPY